MLGDIHTLDLITCQLFSDENAPIIDGLFCPNSYLLSILRDNHKFEQFSTRCYTRNYKSSGDFRIESEHVEKMFTYLYETGECTNTFKIDNLPLIYDYLPLSINLLEKLFPNIWKSNPKWLIKNIRKYIPKL